MKMEFVTLRHLSLMGKYPEVILKKRHLGDLFVVKYKSLIVYFIHSETNLKPRKAPTQTGSFTLAQLSEMKGILQCEVIAILQPNAYIKTSSKHSNYLHLLTGPASCNVLL